MSGCIPTAGLTRWLDSAICSEIELVSFNVQRLLHTWTDLYTLNLPQPKYFEGDCDEMDYVALDNKSYPGTMLRSTNKDNDETISSVTAGILVKKGSEKRITCSFHKGWTTRRGTLSEMKLPKNVGQVEEDLVGLPIVDVEDPDWNSRNKNSIVI
jgi:hypothetical protein